MNCEVHLEKLHHVGRVKFASIPGFLAKSLVLFLGQQAILTTNVDQNLIETILLNNSFVFDGFNNFFLESSGSLSSEAATDGENGISVRHEIKEFVISSLGEGAHYV